LRADFSNILLKISGEEEETSLMIFETAAGDQVHRYNKSIVVLFKGKRKVLSTSYINGGYREDLTAVFNHDCNPGAGMACKLKAPTYAEHMTLIAEELGLDPEYTAGITTAASMDKVAIKVERYKDITVTAIVTGGVEVNGGRVGDPASYDERDGKIRTKHGTINIILEINANLSAFTLTRALVTCTEAKTAALQELMAGSNYSTGIATGSGTDGTIIISNVDSPAHLTDAGKHSKLGELIGKAVKGAVKEALYKQTGLSPEYQHSILKRFKRYGVNEESLWRKYLQMEENNRVDKPNFIHNLHVLDGKDSLVTFTSLYIHLLDQLEWQLLNKEEVKEAAEVILASMQKALGLNEDNLQLPQPSEAQFPEQLIDCFEKLIARVAGGFSYIKT
jgi:adenosylcobinamide amidohydrolase